MIYWITYNQLQYNTWMLSARRYKGKFINRLHIIKMFRTDKDKTLNSQCCTSYVTFFGIRHMFGEERFIHFPWHCGKAYHIQQDILIWHNTTHTHHSLAIVIIKSDNICTWNTAFLSLILTTSETKESKPNFNNIARTHTHAYTHACTHQKRSFLTLNLTRCIGTMPCKINEDVTDM